MNPKSLNLALIAFCSYSLAVYALGYFSGASVFWKVGSLPLYAWLVFVVIRYPSVALPFLICAASTRYLGYRDAVMLMGGSVEHLSNYFSLIQIGNQPISLYTFSIALNLVLVARQIRIILSDKALAFVFTLLCVLSVFQAFQTVYWQSTYGIAANSKLAHLTFFFVLTGYAHVLSHRSLRPLVISAFFILLIAIGGLFDLSMGRPIFAVAAVAPYICVALFLNRLPISRKSSVFIAIILSLTSVYAFIRLTFWTKIYIMFSMISGLVIRLPKNAHIILLIAVVLAPILIGWKLEPRRDIFLQYKSQVAGSGDSSSIADLSNFSFEELKAAFIFKLYNDRASVWGSALSYLGEASFVTKILPETVIYLMPMSYDTRTMGVFSTPHNTWLYYLRAYGIVAGPIYIFLLCFILLNAIKRPSANPMNVFVLRPFVVCVAYVGFNAGDYWVADALGVLLFSVLGICFYTGSCANARFINQKIRG